MKKFTKIILSLTQAYYHSLDTLQRKKKATHQKKSGYIGTFNKPKTDRTLWNN